METMKDDIISQTFSTDLLKMDKRTRWIYISSLILAIAICVIGIIIDELDKVIVSIPIILILIGTIFYDRNFIHVPPAFIIIIIVAMYLSLISNFLISDIWASITSVFTGFVLGTLGIIIAYLSLGKKPGTNKEKTSLIAIQSFSMGVSLYALWVMLAYSLIIIRDGSITVDYTNTLMARSLFNAIGAAVVSVGYYFGYGKGYFDKVIVRFLEKNSATMGLEVDDCELVNSLIMEGESYNLEFKSTLRINLNTGEKDKRMEKAVLKTLVAFLNSDGGTLLVGVEDDGNIMGVDIESFDNRDKMNLHITNLLSSQIGDEFLPFIKFKLVDFGKKESGADKIVVMFTCTPTSSPVFFKEPKEKIEIYFVRSGPSSVELTGVDLLKYVENRRKTYSKKFGKRKNAAAKPQ